MEILKNNKKKMAQRLLNPDAELIETSEELTVYPNFDSMKLREDLLKGRLKNQFCN